MATLAANVAHGWSHGPAGAAVAAWPAASLVGSYELLLWLIRSAAAGSLAREPATDLPGGPADQPSGPAERRTAELRLVPQIDQDSPEHQDTALRDALGSCSREPAVIASWASGPDRSGPGREERSADQKTTEPSAADRPGGGRPDDTDAAAAAAYRASLDSGSPLSERKLAAMFGKTSRRWARNRMAEACLAATSAPAGRGAGD
ncbi:MAG: hypothetical protein ACM3ML_36125 [Micromonosporaceae bacterium]